jgi:hypothetical protein
MAFASSSPVTGETVTLDRRLVLRVLANLLTNAREALPDPAAIGSRPAPRPGAADAGCRLPRATPGAA